MGGKDLSWNRDGETPRAVEVLSREEAAIVRLAAMTLGRDPVEVRRDAILRLAEETSGGGTRAVAGSGAGAGYYLVAEGGPGPGDAEPDSDTVASDSAAEAEAELVTPGPVSADPQPERPRRPKRLNVNSTPAELKRALGRAQRREGWSDDTLLTSLQLAQAINFHSKPGKQDRPGVAMFQTLRSRGVPVHKVADDKGREATMFQVGEVMATLPS